MVAAGLTFGLTILLMPVVLAGLRRLDAVDHPNDRSSHVRPTLRGGGIGPCVACVAVLAAFPGITREARLAFLLVAVGLGLVGLTEDVRGVATVRRLLAQLAVAAAAAFVLRPVLGDAGWSLWLALPAVVGFVAYVNAFNFMDGINGISGAQAITAGAGFALMGWQAGEVQVAAVAGLVAGAALGFLPFNFPNARVFLGDVGSYFLGGWLALVAVLALLSGIPPEAAAAPLLVYLADTGTTLARRMSRGEAWHQPHRTHVYQRLTGLGWSHTRTTAWVAAATAGCTALGVVAVDATTPARAAGGLGMGAIVVLYLASPTLVRRFGSRSLAST